MSQARTNARETALQALYQWQLTGQDFKEDDDRQFLEDKRRFLEQEIAYIEQYMKLIEENIKNYAQQSSILEEETLWLKDDAQSFQNEVRLLTDKYLKGIHRSYFSELYHGVKQQIDIIDAHINEFADRPVESIGLVERAILRIGVYELLNRLDVPYRVILNEGINLAKCFGAQDSHKYINGILDKVAQQKRAVEIQAGK